jgi:LCP family protein required for cell wall assembly
LNQAYLYGNPGFHYYDHPSQGPGLLARTLALNFGVTVDHYVAVSMKTFIGVVDAIGGIDVNLPDGLDGRSVTDDSRRLVFPAGEQHLDGEEALTLARIRNITVFQRADNQNLVMCAVRKKLLNPDVVTQIPEIIASFQGNVQTDLSPEQVSQLACLGSQMPAENIVFASFPREMFNGGETYDPVFKHYVFTWNVDRDKLRDYVFKFQIGAWPANPSKALPTVNVEDSFQCP